MYLPDAKEPFDTIRCYVDTGWNDNVKRISAWAVVKKNDRNRTIDPGFSNMVRDYGYDVFGILLDDRKTKITFGIALLQNR